MTCDLCNDSGWQATGGPPGLEAIHPCINGCQGPITPVTCEHPANMRTAPMEGNYGAGSQWCKKCGASRSDWTDWTVGCVMCKGAGYLYGRIPCPMCALLREEQEKDELVRQALAEQAKEHML